jgi:hypothetical protein
MEALSKSRSFRPRIILLKILTNMLSIFAYLKTEMPSVRILQNFEMLRNWLITNI